MSLGAMKKGKVLVVDDEPRNVRILEQLLEDYSVRTACDGMQGLAAVEQEVPDVVLLDIMMPELDGYEVCKRIKQDKRFGFTKVMLVSGRAMIEERLHGYEVGADDYITKPFDLDEILAKLEVFMRLKTVEEIDAIRRTVLDILSNEVTKPLNGILDCSARIVRSISGEGVSCDTTVDFKDVLECASSISRRGSVLLQVVELVTLLCDLKGRRANSDESLLVKNLLAEDIISHGIALANIRAQEKGVSLVTSVACSSDVSATASKELNVLQRAFNSVLNAFIEHSGQGQSVSVECAVEDDNSVFSLKGLFVCNKDEFASILNPFILGNLSHISDLGFAMVKLATELHGGQFAMTSDAENGTLLKFTIPIVTKRKM